MKRILTSMAAVTLCLGTFALTPVQASNDIDNVEAADLAVAKAAGCLEYSESWEGFTKCYRQSTDGIGYAEGEQEVLDYI